MSGFVVKPASRTGVKLLCGFYGKSGSGKTMSALLFARGIAGPTGKIVLIDSENGRGSLFSDLIPGGYSVLDLDPPFSPMRYAEAIEEAEKHGNVIVIDSMSHEWGGEGGVLDWQEQELDRMAGDDWKKREACKMAAWIKPKLAHKKMVMRLLRSPCQIICCLRGEEKTHMAKDEGKTKVITDQFSSPLFDPRFIYELLINFEMIAKEGKGGFVIPRKVTHQSVWPMLPTENQQISVEHGAALAKWSAAPGHATQPTDPLRPLKAKLWELCKDFRGKEKSFAAVEAKLREWKVLPADVTIAQLAEEELQIVIEKTEIQLGQS